MLKDITLGQYFPGNTVAHRLDPRTKILLVVLYIVALFTAKGVAGYALMGLVLAVCVRISKVGVRQLVRGLKPVLFIIIFTAVLNLFFTSSDEYLFQLGFIRVSEAGLRNAIFMVLRIMLLIMGTFLMTYTTSPISLTDGLERLLNWMKKLHVPVHELAMMMSIALRFIPTLIEETDKIMSAQKAGARILKAAISFKRPRPCCPSWCRCSSAPSAGRTSWPRPWSAAATTAARAGPSSMCCATRPGTISPWPWGPWCWRR